MSSQETLREYTGFPVLVYYISWWYKYPFSRILECNKVVGDIIIHRQTLETLSILFSKCLFQSSDFGIPLLNTEFSSRSVPSIFGRALVEDSARWHDIDTTAIEYSATSPHNDIPALRYA